MRRVLLAILAVGLVGVTGCSGNTSSAALSDTAAHQLQADVLAVTTSAAAHNWTAARTELNRLRTDLANARIAGTVTSARAGAIEAAVAKVSLDIAAASTASTTPSSPRSSIPAATPTTPKPTPTRTRKRGHGGGDGGGGGD
ncbi:MAG: hypothetical protein QOG22_3920 [Pseudonocardiales bacterium]|nr:hypothetical protein [Pseudonocardiales bacterium]